MTLSVRRILQESSKFTGVAVLSKVLSLPVTVFLGRNLSAEQFGAVAAVILVLQYASLISPGFTNASAREVAHHSGAGQAAVAERVESVANGADLLFSSLAFTVIMGVAWFQKTQFTRVGYATVALIYLAERFKTYYFNANYYRQRFNVNVVANAVGALANPLVAVLLVPIVREYALLAAPLAASVAASVCYVVHPEQQLRFRWDPVEALRLLKVGCVLSFVGLVFWAFRLVDRTAITLFMSHSDLGYYFYAATYVLMGLNVLADFGRVLESMLWSRGGQVADTEQFRRDTVKLSLFIACVGGAAIPALQAGYETLITLLVPKFRGTVDLFNVMSLAIFPSLVVMVPHILLRSKAINRQHWLAWIYTAATLFGFAVDWLAIEFGYGLMTIAWLSLICASLVSLWLIVLTRASVSSTPTGFLRFVGKLLGPAGAVLIAFLVTLWGRQSVGVPHVLALSCACIVGAVPLICFVVFSKVTRPQWLLRI